MDSPGQLRGNSLRRCRLRKALPPALRATSLQKGGKRLNKVPLLKGDVPKGQGEFFCRSDPYTGHM